MTYSVSNDLQLANNLIVDDFCGVILIDVKGLYIHFPFCKHLCNYCDFYKFQLEPSKLKDFKSNIRSQINLIDSNKYNFEGLETIYLGGGTPSLWSLDLLDFLDELNSRLSINKSKLKEVTLEVDPDTWTERDFDAWLKWGINRFSIGVQAMEKSVLGKLDRRHNIDEIEKTLKYLSDRDLNYSVDFLMGAPVKTRDIRNELEKVLKYRPKHISSYILKTRANYPHKSELPSDDICADEYLLLSTHLKEHGYEHYEVSNFAKPGYKSRHNSAYWELENILAIGPNATGFYTEKGQAKRYQVKANSSEFLYENLTSSEEKLERIYLQLRTNKGISLRDYFSADEINKLRNNLVRWDEEGYFEEFDNTVLKLNSKGFLVLDNLMDEFFKYTSI